MEKYFIVGQKSILNILSSMQPICSKRTTLDTTSYILFNVGYKELVLKSTDLEISLQASCPLTESTLTQSQSFLVSGRRVFEVVKELEGPITCTIEQNQLLFKAGSVNLALNIKDAQEFPPFPDRIENLMQIEAPSFLSMLDRVAFLIPQSNANPALNGLFMEVSPEEIAMTATDGHCLAQVRSAKYKLLTSKSWLLPRRAIFELKKILESSPDKTLFIGMCGNQLVFSGELFNFFTKLLADAFPQYKSIMDKTSFIPASIDRSRFTKTLRRSACLLSGQFIATQFAFSQDKVHVSMNNKEVGALNEELPMSGPSEMLDMRFYAPYMLNGLASFTDENVTFYVKSTSKPIVFESNNDDIHMTYLVMPVAPTSA